MRTSSSGCAEELYSLWNLWKIRRSVCLEIQRAFIRDCGWLCSLFYSFFLWRGICFPFPAWRSKRLFIIAGSCLWPGIVQRENYEAVRVMHVYSPNFIPICRLLIFLVKGEKKRTEKKQKKMAFVTSCHFCIPNSIKAPWIASSTAGDTKDNLVSKGAWSPRGIGSGSSWIAWTWPAISISSTESHYTSSPKPYNSTWICADWIFSHDPAAMYCSFSTTALFWRNSPWCTSVSPGEMTRIKVTCERCSRSSRRTSTLCCVDFPS